MPNASQFPAKPIEIYVSAQKGGPSDQIARIIAAKLSENWNHPISIEHKAPMNACFDHVAKATPDGHTILMSGGGFFINGTLYRNLPFDPAKDFDPITLVASIANVLLIHPSVPARTVAEFIAYAKANPGKLKYGSSGFGGPPHLAGELFKQMTGVDLVHAPYKSHAAAGVALAEGKEVQVFFDAVLSARPHIDAGEVIPLAVTPLKRVPILPDIPTLTECGIVGYEINPDMGMMAPAGTPPEVIAKLSEAIAAIMHLPDVKAHLQSIGMEALGTPPKEFADYARNAYGKWAHVLKAAGIEPRDLPASPAH